MQSYKPNWLDVDITKILQKEEIRSGFSIGKRELLFHSKREIVMKCKIGWEITEHLITE